MKRILVLKTNADLWLLTKRLYSRLLPAEEYSNIGSYQHFYAFKAVDKSSREGVYKGGVPFPDGSVVKDPNQIDYNSRLDCGAGLNLATLEWCSSYAAPYWDKNRIILKVKFNLDAICIPFISDGKFRVQQCEVIGQVDQRGRLIKKKVEEKKEE